MHWVSLHLMTPACEPVLNSQTTCTFLFALALTSITPTVQLEDKIKVRAIFDIHIQKYNNETLFVQFIKFRSSYVLKLWIQIFYKDFWVLRQYLSKQLILVSTQNQWRHKITTQGCYDNAEWIWCPCKFGRFLNKIKGEEKPLRKAAKSE